MGILSNAFNSAVHLHRMTFIGSKINEWVVEPFVSKYVDNIDVKSKIEDKYDPSEHTQEEIESYEAAGKDLAEFAENIAKYSDDLADDNSIKASLVRMVGRIGECAEDDPAAAGRYVVDMKFGSNQMLNTAQYVNEKIREAEETKTAITADDIMKWGKEGVAMTVAQTASDLAKNKDGADSEKADEVSEDCSNKLDKAAYADAGLGVSYQDDASEVQF